MKMAAFFLLAPSVLIILAIQNPFILVLSDAYPYELRFQYL